VVLFTRLSFSLTRIANVLRSEGIVSALLRVVQRGRRVFRNLVGVLRYPFANHAIELEAILARHRGKPVIVMRPIVDWNIPLYQRPHHLAKEFARKGFLYFFCTDNAFQDNVRGFVEKEHGCIITDQYSLILRTPFRKVFHLYSTDYVASLNFVHNQQEAGNIFLYEYIDEIHEDISGRPIPVHVLNKHDALLRDERVICVASAQKLYDEVKRRRKKNYVLVTNGVEYEHFTIKREESELPPVIAPVMRKRKPVIGYFGALAKWVDYGLVVALAEARPEYEILLIGWDYDRSIRKWALDKHDNITVLGPVNYEILPTYACWFDVSIIPFRINAVTESTSPIKLFEYMALGHPIVTTDLPESRKYHSVLIGRSEIEFIESIDMALSMREKESYLSVLRKEAMENTWQEKARQVATLIRAKWDEEPTDNTGTEPSRAASIEK